jgi:hypothetical protein
MPTPNETESLDALHKIGHTTPSGDIAHRCEAICHEWLDDHLEELELEELWKLRAACRDVDESLMKRTTLKRPCCPLTKRLNDEIARRTTPAF